MLHWRGHWKTGPLTPKTKHSHEAGDDLGRKVQFYDKELVLNTDITHLWRFVAPNYIKFGVQRSFSVSNGTGKMF